MAAFLIVVKQNHWYPYSPKGCAWLGQDELLADPVTNLRTTGGELSVWRVDAGRSDEERVAVAMAMTRGSISILEYIVFDEAVLERVGIDIESSQGNTPDGEINSSQHYDLIQLTVKKIVEFVRTLIMDEHVEPLRLSKKEIKELARCGLEAGQLDEEKIRIPDVRGKVGI